MTTYTRSFRSIDINENNIYYHKDFSTTYDKSKRDIATVIISQPITTNEIVIFTSSNDTVDFGLFIVLQSNERTFIYCTTPNNESYFINDNDKTFTCSDSLFAVSYDKKFILK